MKAIYIAVFCMLTLYPVSGQLAGNEDIGIGKVSGKIYSNFHYGLNTPDRKTAFAITRAYFGYERNLSNHFSAIVKLDVGSPEDISEYSRIRRYAYFKNAGIKYNSGGGFTVQGGLIDMLQFKVQEKFWNYRYLYKSYMDEYRIGPSADLGISAAYTFNERLNADIVLSNGEGYSSPQRDNTFKSGWGVTFVPVDKVKIRTYYTCFISPTPQMTFSLFTGYQIPKYRVGGELIYQKNYKFNAGRDRYGYSLYNTYILNDKLELFLRYDQLYSNIIGSDKTPWNLPEDGSAIVGGIQFSPISNVHLTADYQDWYAYARNGNKANILFIHMEVIF